MDAIGKTTTTDKLAPIVLFVFDRPDHALQTLESLSKNILADQSKLYIYCDGPKFNSEPEQLARIAKVEKIVKSKQWCSSVTIVKHKTNKGLANSIIQGVSEIVNKYGKIIVLEDDIVTTPGFLQFMNAALDKYEQQNKVMQISGYIYPTKTTSKHKNIFLKLMACWGWGTWKRAWQFYQHDIESLFNSISNKKTIHEFNIYGKADFYEQLIGNKKGNIYTWAVRWYASWFLQDGLCLFPSTSLVENIGHDGSGVHCVTTSNYNNKIVEEIPVSEDIKVIEDKNVKKAISTFFKYQFGTKKNSFIPKIKKVFVQNLRIQLRKILFFNNPFLSFSNYIQSSKVSQLSKVYPPYEITKCTIDDYSYISKNAQLSMVNIGKFCSIGPNLVAGWGIHPTNSISTSPSFYSNKKQNGISFIDNSSFIERKEISIGNDVFIGANVTILDGVTISNGAVIGAGSVVSKDIPAYAIAFGNPIKIVRFRFENAQIEKLQKIKWWNWPIEKIKTMPKDLFDIESFLDKNNL